MSYGSPIVEALSLWTNVRPEVVEVDKHGPMVPSSASRREAWILMWRLVGTVMLGP